MVYNLENSSKMRSKNGRSKNQASTQNLPNRPKRAPPTAQINKKAQKFTHFLKEICFFSLFNKEPEFSFSRQKKSYSTTFGGCLTIVFAVLITLSGFYFFRVFANKENVITSVYEEEMATHPTFNFRDTDNMLGFVLFNRSRLIKNKYAHHFFTLRAEHVTIKHQDQPKQPDSRGISGGSTQKSFKEVGSSSGSSGFKVVKKDLKYFNFTNCSYYEDYFERMSVDAGFNFFGGGHLSTYAACPLISKSEDWEVKGTALQLPYSYLRLYIYPCSMEQKRTCVDPATLSNVFVQVVFIKKSVNFKNKTSPLHVSIDTDMFVSMGFKTTSHYQIYLKNNTIYDDENDFLEPRLKDSFVDFEEIHQYTAYRKENTFTCTSEEIDSGECPPYLVLDVRSGRKVSKNLRIYKKPFQIISIIGGFGDVFFMLLSLIHCIWHLFSFRGWLRKQIFPHGLEDWDQLTDPKRQNSTNSEDLEPLRSTQRMTKEALMAEMEKEMMDGLGLGERIRKAEFLFEGLLSKEKLKSVKIDENLVALAMFKKWRKQTILTKREEEDRKENEALFSRRKKSKLLNNLVKLKQRGLELEKKYGIRLGLGGKLIKQLDETERNNSNRNWGSNERAPLGLISQLPKSHIALIKKLKIRQKIDVYFCLLFQQDLSQLTINSYNFSSRNNNLRENEIRLQSSLKSRSSRRGKGKRSLKSNLRSFSNSTNKQKKSVSLSKLSWLSSKRRAQFSKYLDEIPQPIDEEESSSHKKRSRESSASRRRGRTQLGRRVSRRGNSGGRIRRQGKSLSSSRRMMTGDKTAKNSGRKERISTRKIESKKISKRQIRKEKRAQMVSESSSSSRRSRLENFLMKSS